MRLPWEESAFSDEELAGYEHFWDGISVEKTLYGSAIRKGLAEGKAEGKAEGLAEGKAEGKAEGLAEGMEKGIEKGMAEGKAKEQRLIAANLKKQGIDIETIAQCTGLPVEEIYKL